MRLSFLLSTLLFFALAGCGGNPEPIKIGMGNPAIMARIIQATETDWPVTYEAVGTVRARTATVISAKVTGYVQQVTVRAGDPVAAGQTLVVLDASDLEISVRAARAAVDEARNARLEVENAVAGAKATLDLAQVTFGRMNDLFEKKSISNQEFDEASARLKMARSGYEMAVSRRAQLESKIRQAEEGLAAAEAMRGYARITAPFAGTVTEKQAEPGQLAAPGQPLLTLERGGAYRLEADVAESYLDRIQPGQPVRVVIAAIGRTIEARVTERVAAVDAATRTFLVRIDLPADQGLRSGLFGRAVFTLGSRRMLTVPAAAIMEQGQLQTVYVARGGVARIRSVTAGAGGGESREILSGLTAGERIVCPLPPGIHDGARLEKRP